MCMCNSLWKMKKETGHFGGLVEFAYNVYTDLKLNIHVPSSKYKSLFTICYGQITFATTSHSFLFKEPSFCCVRFEVSTAITMQSKIIFWYVTPCRLI
jgi:hypothetical protein